MGSLADGKAYPALSYISDKEELLRQIVNVVNGLLQGHSNNTSSVTLTANAGSTTLTDPRISGTSFIGLMATTANAAAALGGIYFNTFAKGSCVIHHANDANVDKTFKYLIIG